MESSVTDVMGYPPLAEPGLPGPGQSGPWLLARANLQLLIDLLREDGRTVIGPTIRDEAIVYDQITSVDELPVGAGDRQSPGHYGVERHRDRRFFDFNVGPTSWKRWTFPPIVPMTVGRREGKSVTFEPHKADVPRLAFLGVRACELAALGIQDRVFLGGPYVDDDYRTRREAAFVVAVNCAVAGDTCFCTSMGTGPEVRGGYDLALTELDEGFLVRSGSAEGAEVLARLPLKAADAGQVFRAAQQVGKVAATIGDPLPTAGLHDRLLAQWDSPRWAAISERCLMCANCTMVCPTCFCSSVVQRSDLDGNTSTSERVWDFCFTSGFARVAGGSFRTRPRDRYRQWLTHKFATWVDQFGSYGCVGCGRCISWCPVGIDVRQELMAIAPPLDGGRAGVATAPVAASPAHYATARVRETRQESADVATLVIEADEGFAAGRPGQFAMVAMPAFPALPISISRYQPDAIELTIRAAGPATSVLERLTPGDEIGIRGPLGTAWPVDRAVGRDIVVVTGGIGLAPLRPLIDAIVRQRLRFETIRLFYGARTPADLLFRDDLDVWAAEHEVDVDLIVDRAGPDWTGRVGVVTNLFDRATWDGSRAVAFVCGPERMMQATVDVLAERGFTSDRIFVTLERHMECGIGLCGHCQMGRLFVCKDGPVFSLAELGDVFGREGI